MYVPLDVLDVPGATYDVAGIAPWWDGTERHACTLAFVSASQRAAFLRWHDLLRAGCPVDARDRDDFLVAWDRASKYAPEDIRALARIRAERGNSAVVAVLRRMDLSALDTLRDFHAIRNICWGGR